MDYEKKYEKLVDAVKVLRDNNPSDEGIQNWVNDNVPELKESESERTRKGLTDFLKGKFENCCSPTPSKKVLAGWIAWLEKQGEVCHSIMWHSILEEPEEKQELLCEWESDDATWHEVAFYHSKSKTFWTGEIQVENVIKWIYLNELLEKQGEQKLINDTDEGIVNAVKDTSVLDLVEPKPAWSEEDEVRFTNIIIMLKEGASHHFVKGDITNSVGWLKSLKERMKGE